MTISIAMYEGSWAHIRDRFGALGLDAEVLTFDKSGGFADGRAAEEVAVDYLWFSTHLAADGVRDVAFDLAARLRRLEVLQTFNAGLDAPVYKRLSEMGVRICNSSAQGVAIAEYVFAQVMSLTHPVATQREMQAAGTWRTTPFRELSGMNWLIVGFGPIGSAVAARARAFGSGVSVIRRSQGTVESADRVGGADDLARFAADADVILLACPLTEATRGLAGPALFAATKPDAILVNIARGPVVDDAALIAALDEGRLGHAVLDVFHTEPLPAGDPLWSHPKVRVTPHTSFAGDGSRGRWDQLFLDNLQRYAAGEPLIREVAPQDI